MLLVSSSGTGIATGLRNESSGVRFPTEAGDKLGTGASFSGVQQRWCEVDHLPTFSDGVKNERRETSAPPHAFMTSTGTTLLLPSPLSFSFN